SRSFRSRRFRMRVSTSAVAFLLLAGPALAHVVSMSSSEMQIVGKSGHYELRMPLYEAAHIQQPEPARLENIRFASGGREARLVNQNCSPQTDRDTYFCTAEYEFAAPVETLDVECTFPAVTVANHMHTLRARAGDKTDQGFFDRSFQRATLRFRPATPVETAITEAGTGFMTALSGPAP